MPCIRRVREFLSRFSDISFRQLLPIHYAVPMPKYNNIGKTYRIGVVYCVFAIHNIHWFIKYRSIWEMRHTSVDVQVRLVYDKCTKHARYPYWPIYFKYIVLVSIHLFCREFPLKKRKNEMSTFMVKIHCGPFGNGFRELWLIALSIYNDNVFYIDLLFHVT